MKHTTAKVKKPKYLFFIYFQGNKVLKITEIKNNIYCQF